MKTSDFRYEVSIELEFTDEEFNVIELCMMRHYDAKTAAASKQGGFLYGWRNRRQLAHDMLLTCSFEQVSSCAKAIEMPSSVPEDTESLWIRVQLQRKLKDTLESINAETRRIHGKE